MIRGVFFSSIVLILLVGFGLSHIGMIRYEEVVHPGEEFTVHVNLVNNGRDYLENIRLYVYIHELDTFVSSPLFDLNDNSKMARTLLMDIPLHARPGTYIIEIGVSNDGAVSFRDKEFRQITIV